MGYVAILDSYSKDTKKNSNKYILLRNKTMFKHSQIFTFAQSYFSVDSIFFKTISFSRKNHSRKSQY